MVGTLLRGCMCYRSCCNHDLSFDLIIVTMSFKILSWLLDSVTCRTLTLGRDVG